MVAYRLVYLALVVFVDLVVGFVACRWYFGPGHFYFRGSLVGFIEGKLAGLVFACGVVAFGFMVGAVTARSCCILRHWTILIGS